LSFAAPSSPTARLIVLEKLATDSGFDRAAQEVNLRVGGAEVAGVRLLSTQSTAQALAAVLPRGYRVGLTIDANARAAGEGWWIDLPAPSGEDVLSGSAEVVSVPIDPATPVRWMEVVSDAELGALLAWWWGVHARVEPLAVRVRRATARLPQTTEVERTVVARVGQDLFRAALFDCWKGRCAVSGIALPALLRASHIKPWAVSNDVERLDVHNGLLLAAHWDALFDRGLISFENDGRMLVSGPVVAEWVRLSLVPVTSMRLERTSEAQRAYLEFHRIERFGAVMHGGSRE
jgi:hypothetical protein